MLKDIFLAYKNKITNKFFGYVHTSSICKKKGDILISYITSPFTLLPWEYKTDPHSNYWEVKEIARLFSVRGFDVDCINADEHRFIPKKQYIVCIDIQKDLERLNKYLPHDCKKVLHIDNPYYKEYNLREKKRLDDLNKRRGVSLTPKRQVKDTQSAEVAEYFEGFGNTNVHSTYKKFGKTIFPIPISVVEQYPYSQNKDFNKARKHFLYFGGGGAVLKGLDIAIEAFALLPDLHLHIVGPSAFEKEFENVYKNELSLPNITRHGRPKTDKSGHIKLGDKDFIELLNSCAAIIYPSSAEGTSGAVIQAMHAGLIPIVTHETGISEKIRYIPIENPTPESVAKIARNFSEIPENKMKQLSKEVWDYVTKNHTKETFSRSYGEFIDKILKI